MNTKTTYDNADYDSYKLDSPEQSETWTKEELVDFIKDAICNLSADDFTDDSINEMLNDLGYDSNDFKRAE